MPFTFTGANSKRGLKFKKFFGDVDWRSYGGSFISKRLNNGDFDYWLILQVANLEDTYAQGEKSDRYYVTLNVVAPSQVSDEEMRRASESVGWEGDYTDTEKVQILAEYGIYATLWQKTGNNINSLMREARAQANGSQMMFGFMMDERQNGLGATGWDRIKGNYWPTPDVVAAEATQEENK